MIFFLYIFFIAFAASGALRLGKEALVSFVVLQAVLCNLFVLKRITLFGLEATATDALAIGISLTLNLLQEFFSKKEALRAVWISFYASVFYVVIGMLHLAYAPSPTDLSHVHFSALLTPMLRILTASFIAYLLSQQLDCRLFAFFKERFPHYSFALRSSLSMLVSQFMDTLLFTFLAFYGAGILLGEIIAVSYLLKVIVLFGATFFVALVKKSFLMTLKAQREE